MILCRRGCIVGGDVLITKLAHLAAKEQKAAAEAQREARKLEVEARMFETYNKLLALDVSLMTDEERNDHANTMKCLKKKIFSDYI
jgi:hypothetical protein